MNIDNQNSLQQMIRNKKFIISITLISIVAFLEMLVYSGNSSLWVDDLATIHFSWNYSFKESILNAYYYDPTVAPLFYGIASLWLKFVPYGTEWLRLLPEFFVILGIYSMAFLGAKMYDIKTGIIAALITACSSTLMINGGYAFRPYSMFFFLTVIVLYMFIVRIEGKDLSWISITLFGFMLSILNYTHYFGTLICAALGIYELFKILKKELKAKFIVSYFIMLATFLPYLFGAFLNAMKLWSQFWPAIPKWWDLVNICGALLSHIKIFEYIFTFAIVYSILMLISNIKNKQYDFVNNNLYVYLMLGIVFFTLSVVFIFSKYLVPTFSLWVDRYFLCLMPSMFIVIAVYINKLFIFTKSKFNNIAVLALMITVFGICFYGINDNVKKYSTQPFQQAADFLRQQGDIYNNDTTVYVPIGWGDGWKYYVTLGNKQKAFNYIVTSDDFSNVRNYKTVYVFEVCDGMNQENKEYLQQTHTGNVVNEQYNIWKYTKNE